MSINCSEPPFSPRFGATTYARMQIDLFSRSLSFYIATSYYGHVAVGVAAATGNDWGVLMTALLKQSAWVNFESLRRKLRFFGVESETDLNAIVSRIRVGPGLCRGEDILAADSVPGHSTVLLEGIGCLYERQVDGKRQIFAFQYPGDFCELTRRALRAPGVAVGAATECSVGFMENRALEQLMEQYPSLATALLRSTIVEAGALWAKLRSSRQTALQRVAHLLCEQLVRQEVGGIQDGFIPICQVDLAEAAGLSAVHACRTFKELQCMGLLVRVGRSTKVVDRERLARLAEFDGSYLDMPQVLARWQVKV